MVIRWYVSIFLSKINIKFKVHHSLKQLIPIVVGQTSSDIILMFERLKDIEQVLYRIQNES